MNQSFSIKNKHSWVLIFSTFILLFVAPGEYSMPYLKLGITEISAFLLIISFFGIVFNVQGCKSVEIDSVVVLLFIRTVILSFSVILNGGGYNAACFFGSIFSVLFYLWAINTPHDRKEIVNWSVSICFILFLQVSYLVYQLIQNGTPLFTIKANIQIPIGGSNYIAAIIIIFLPVVYFLCENKIAKSIILSLMVFALLLTRSTSGVSVFALYVLIVLFIERRGILFRVTIVIGVLSVAALIIYKVEPHYFERFFSVYRSMFSGNAEDRYIAFNGRFPLYQQIISIIKTHPVFGYGLRYRLLVTNESMAHNWVLELLVTSGIAGFISYCLAITKLIKQFLKNKIDTISISGVVTIVGVLIQGLFEPSIGTMRFDTLFWILMGVLISY